MDSQPKTPASASQPVEFIHLVILNAFGLPGSLILAFSAEPNLRIIGIGCAIIVVAFSFWWLYVNRRAEKANSSK